MFANAILTIISLALMAYLSKHLYLLDRRLREDARASKLRNAVDWTKPPEPKRQSRPRSRISDFLKI